MPVRERGRLGPWLWILVVLITVGSAYYQRVTGPTYPVRIREEWQGRTIKATLERSHGGPGDQTVEVRGIGEGVRGELFWRRYPSSEAFSRKEMARAGDRLTSALPHQPPAGKLEYRVELRSETGNLTLPHEGGIVTRFKGNVPLLVLIPHIIFMFAAMLLSNRAGLGAAIGRSDLCVLHEMGAGSSPRRGNDPRAARAEARLRRRTGPECPSAGI